MNCIGFWVNYLVFSCSDLRELLEMRDLHDRHQNGDHRHDLGFMMMIKIIMMIKSMMMIKMISIIKTMMMIKVIG